MVDRYFEFGKAWNSIFYEFDVFAIVVWISDFENICIWVGDFGQLPPIGDASLIMPNKGQSRRAAAGQRLFNLFEEVVRLRRIYRQKGKSIFKDSTLRLRDAAMTFEDYELWQKHDLSSDIFAPLPSIDSSGTTMGSQSQFKAEDVELKRVLEDDLLSIVKYCI